MKLPRIILLVVLAFSLSVFAVRQAHAAGTLYVNPNNTPAAPIGHVFTVQIKVANIDPFTGWDVQVVTDPNVINATTINITRNMFSANYSVTPDQIYEQFHCINGDGACAQSGEGPGIVHSALVILKPPPQSGPSSGLLFTITYKVVGSLGYSAVQISNDIIVNGGTSMTVDHVTVSGKYGVPPTPDYSVSPNPSLLSVGQNSSGTTKITVSSIGSYTGTILLDANSNETTLTLSVSPSSMFLSPNGSNSSTLTISAASTTPLTSYTITVRATNGTTTRTTTVTVGITPPPYFVIGVSPGLLFIHDGDSATTTVTVQSRFGFAGSVSLKAPIVAPAGLLASFSPEVITILPSEAVNSTLTISTPTSAIRFRYTINITATSGLSSKAASLIIIPPLGEISLDLNPGSFTLKPGDSASALITVSTHDYLWGTVDIAASMIGGTVNLNSTSFVFGPVGRTTATFSLNMLLDGATVPGNYNLTLTVYTLCFTPSNQANNCSPGGRTLAHSQTFSVIVSSTQVPNRPSGSVSILGLSPLSYFGALGAFGALFVIIVALTIRKRREEESALPSVPSLMS